MNGLGKPTGSYLRPRIYEGLITMVYVYRTDSLLINRARLQLPRRLSGYSLLNEKIGVCIKEYAAKKSEHERGLHCSLYVSLIVL